MAIGKIRAAIIIALFATSATIPVLMETAIVPMMNLLKFIENFAEVEYAEDGVTPIELKIKYESLINSIQEIRCLTDESNVNQTVIQTSDQYNRPVNRNPCRCHSDMLKC